VPVACAPADDAVPADWDEFDRYARPKLEGQFSFMWRAGIDPAHVVQDALIAAHDEFTPLGTYGTMLRWTARRCVWIGSRIQQRGFGKYEEPTGDAADAIAAQQPAPGPGPEGVAVDRVDMENALAQLSEKDQQVLRLDSLGVTPEEMAGVLGIRPGTARVRLFRARARLAKAVGATAPALVWWRLRRVAPPPEAAPSAAFAPAAPGVSTAATVLSMVAAFAAPASPAGRYVAEVGGVPTPRASGTAAAPGPATRRGLAPVSLSPVAQAGTAGSRDPDAARQALAGPAGDLPKCLGLCTLDGLPGEAEEEEEEEKPDEWRGDRIRIRRLGADSPGVEQFVTPGCDHIPDNAVTDCDPGEEPEDYIVKDVPPTPHPGGTP
jgi:DNA-directed RNA polymerase specialized sigma24 family protein